MRRILILLALLCLLPLRALAQEEDDRGFLTSFIEDNLSGLGRTVRIEGFEGALSSRATFKELTIADDQGVWLTIKDGAIGWARAKLLLGRVEISELSAAEIILPRRPVSDAAPTAEASGSAGFSLPELPVSVKIDKINAAHVVLGEPLIGIPVEVRLEGSMGLEGGEGAADLRIVRTDDKDGTITFKGSYANATRKATLDLLMSEEAGGIAATKLGLPGAPSVELAVHGDGVIDDFATDIALSTDGAPRLTGKVQLIGGSDDPAAPAQRFTAAISGDIAPLFMPDYREFFGTDVSLEADGARTASGQLDLTRLVLGSRGLDLSGRLSLAPGGLPEQAVLTLRMGLSDGSDVLLPIAGAPTTLHAADLKLRYDKSEDDGWTLTGGMYGLAREGMRIGAVALDGSGKLVQPDAAGGAPATASGAIRFDASRIAMTDKAMADALGEKLSGTANFDWIQGQPFNLPAFDVTGDGYGAKGQMSLASGTGGAEVTGELTAEVADLGRYSGLAGRTLGGAGEITLSGSGGISAGTFDLEATVAGRDLSAAQPELDGLLKGASRIAASAKRDTTGITLRSLTVDATTLHAEASGVVRTGASDITADLAFRDLSVLGTGYRGALTGQARLTEAGGVRNLSLTASGDRLGMGQELVDGLLAGTTALDVAVAETAGAYRIDRLNLANNQITVAASGLLDLPAGKTDVSATLGLADLKSIGPGYGGGFNGEVHLTEAAGTRTVTLTANADGLSINQPMVDGMLAGRTALDLALAETGGAYRIDKLDLANNQITLTASGMVDQPGGKADVKAALNLPNLRALGGGYRGAFSGNAHLTEANGTRSLTLDANGSGVAIGQDAVDRILAGATALKLQGSETGGKIQVNTLQLTNPQLQVTGTGQIADGTRRLELNARLANMALLAPGFPGPLTAGGQITDNGNTYTVDLSGSGPGATTATIKGSVATDLRQANLTIEGGAQSGLLNPLLEPQNIAGPIRFDLRLNGSLALQSLGGRVTLDGGQLVAPALGIELEQMSVAADLGGGRVTLSGGSNVRGGGRLNISGPITLAAPFDGDLSIGLSSVRLRDPDLYDMTADGSLRMQGALAGGAQISGTITLGKAELRVPSSGFGSASVPQGIEHVGESAAVRQSLARAGLIETKSEDTGRRAPPYGLDLTLSAPNKVFIRGRGLDAEVGGGLHLGGTTANVIPAGRFGLIRGRLDILGKRFNISEGLFEMQGAMMPYIRFVATTESDGISASIVIEGNAAEPQISFTSSPQLPEDEVVSQLLFQRSMTDLSPFQAAQLASAVATLAGKGGEGIIAGMRRSVGLDDLDVTTGADGSAGLRAGKYISEKIYTDVTVGADNTSQINLNLDVRPGVKLRGSASADGNTGVGLYYERDY